MGPKNIRSIFSFPMTRSAPKKDRRREYLEELFLKFGKDFHTIHS
jgi:hypothetical protein